MLVRTITDSENGRKWEIYKKSENSYYYKYYEFFKQIGWRLTGTAGNNRDGYFTKDCIEWDFDISIT